MTTYGPPEDPEADIQVALYQVTPPFLGPPLQVITSGAGSRGGPAIGYDPASGRYTLISVKSVDGTPGTVMEVYQRVSGVWTYQYEFNAAGAGEMNPALSYMLAAEPFVYQSHLYFAFVTADAGDFYSTEEGNIRITRAESGGQPTFFKLLNEATSRRRTEPEVHYPTNDSPVIFYTQRATPDDDCTEGYNMLRRARTNVAG